MIKENRNRTQGIALGFLAGYVDTLGFIALFGLFTAHVTGNFILIGAALADPGHMSILLKLLAFPAFVAGVAVMPLLVAWTTQHQVRALPLALGLQLVLLAGFMLCGMAAMPLGDSATSRLLLAELAPTSMMTGNVTQVVIDSVDYLRGARGPGIGTRCAKFVWPVLAFGIGCASAAFAWQAFGFIALCVPLVILAGLIRVALAAPPVPVAA
jgi:uncharacterized membrane protein YoaK (UPF0700 family)